MSFAEIRAHRGVLWAEFVGLFLIVPVAVAIFLPPNAMLPVLFSFTALGAWLLQRTPGFDWSDLKRGWDQVRLLPVLGFAVITLIVSLGVVYLTAPDAAFGLVRHQPYLLLLIVLIYPILSALPQEVIFRPLFFRRYGRILPAGATMGMNAAVFSFAHLMYWSAVVAVMTFFGGLVFGWAYARRGSFPLAVVMHAVAGWVLFTAGLGVYFYSGNVQRPF
ncbi:MAG: CPBP family intramembrane metalloprotease [Cereibacter sphaeroides]|uniref:CPBP family intramembrane metalloprotease n=1 Tax=Cereibacter sphaeroides TaxID=1063 RepID=A0A2W5TJW0_CERSP|nr:MAG: CPBP family intramembrane metalloprotease [Cereibacter sphaeroides]